MRPAQEMGGTLNFETKGFTAIGNDLNTPMAFERLEQYRPRRLIETEAVDVEGMGNE